MSHLRYFFPLLLLLSILTACNSTPNPDAPPTDQGHVEGWFDIHNVKARADVESCKTCHGADYGGGSVGVSCLVCHPGAPPFSAHPASWGTDTVAGHQTFPTQLSWTSCATASCHGPDLQGGTANNLPSGPSCFTLTGCHVTPNNGPPPPATHTAAYDTPADHGPAAKQNQVYCLNCHGRPTNNFDGGFVAINYGGAGNCSSAACHPNAKAHPTDWQGTNDLNANGYLARHWGVTATAITNSCSICHNVNSAGTGPMAGAPSCFSASFENSNLQGVFNCHSGGPPGHDSNSFTWAGTCNNCHSDGGIGIVAGVHNGNCLNCHISSGDRTRRTGINGDATQADLLAVPTSASCLTCHDPATYPTDAFHHLLPSFISRDCVDCHTLNVAHAVSFNPVTDLSGGITCSTSGCHDGEVENWTNIMARHDLFNGNGTLVCDTCHKSTQQTSRGGTYNENRTIEEVIFDAMNSGATVNCLECHLDRQDSHSGHNASTFSFGADGCDAAGCHDAARYATAGTPAVVNDVHGALCTTCHTTAAGGLGTAIVGNAANGIDGDATLAAQPFNPAATCLTCHPAATYPATAIHHDHAEYVANNCTFCHAGGPPGHPTDFDPSSDGCDACHNQALYGTAGVPNVVTDIHGGQCTHCHASSNGDATNEIVGANGDGDATQADGTAGLNNWANVTCLTCHGVGAGVNAIPAVHHDGTSAGAGPVQAVAGNCTFCHADPRPALNASLGGGFNTPQNTLLLACRECHTVNGNMYANTYTPASTNAVGGTIATNFATVQQAIMDGNSGTVDHSFATTIQNFGACLTCHLANVPVIYGTSSRKVNVFHARPLDWFLNGNDTNDTGANDQTEVLRGAPGRETFRVFGNDQDPDNTNWPLGDLRGQGLRLSAYCPSSSPGDRPYETCTNNEDRWRNQGLKNIQDDWDIPVNGFELRMTIPCGNWNDDGSRPYCNGSSQSVPYFNN